LVKREFSRHSGFRARATARIQRRLLQIYDGPNLESALTVRSVHF